MARIPSFVAQRPLIIPAVIAALMLLGALGPRPHWYFHLLRWVVCAAAVVFAAYGTSTKRMWAGWVFGVLAVLFNPIVPLHLSRSTWQPIDAAAGMMFFVGAILLTTDLDRRKADLHSKDPPGSRADQSADPKEMLVEFPDRIAIPVLLTQVGDRLYRLEEIPCFGFHFVEFGSYLDVIEVGPPADDGELRFIRVAERSDWRTLGPYTISGEVWDAMIDKGKQRPSWLRDLVSRGGNWFAAYSQMFICLPPGLDFDPTPCFKEEDGQGDSQPQTNGVTA